MAVSLAQVFGKAKAYVDTLGKLPCSQYGNQPSGQFGRDFNNLRQLVLEVAPDLDERLLGKYVSVHPGPGDCEICDASFVELETYVRQIMEQLALGLDQTTASPNYSATTTNSAKAYDIDAIRQKHKQAYRPWSAEDDAHLRSRFLKGATLGELVNEFGRQASAIRSRLKKLKLQIPPSTKKPRATTGTSSATAKVMSISSSWRDERPRTGRVWTADEDRKLLRMFEEGLPIATIAKSLGRGEFSVEVRLCKLGHGIDN